MYSLGYEYCIAFEHWSLLASLLKIYIAHLKLLIYKILPKVVSHQFTQTSCLFVDWAWSALSITPFMRLNEFSFLTMSTRASCPRRNLLPPHDLHDHKGLLVHCEMREVLVVVRIKFMVSLEFLVCTCYNHMEITRKVMASVTTWPTQSLLHILHTLLDVVRETSESAWSLRHPQRPLPFAAFFFFIYGDSILTITYECHTARLFILKEDPVYCM